MSDTKTCRRCEQELTLNSFHVKQGAEKDRHPYCKECRRELGGHTERQPPKLATPNDADVDEVMRKIETSKSSSLREKLKAKHAAKLEEQDREYAQLVAETLNYSDHPGLQKKRNVRLAAKTIRDKPVLSHEQVWDKNTEIQADLLFDAWDKRAKQNRNTYQEIQERLPINDKHSERNYTLREGWSYEMYCEYYEREENEG